MKTLTYRATPSSPCVGRPVSLAYSLAANVSSILLLLSFSFSVSLCPPSLSLSVDERTKLFALGFSIRDRPERRIDCGVSFLIKSRFQKRECVWSRVSIPFSDPAFIICRVWEGDQDVCLDPGTIRWHAARLATSDCSTRKTYRSSLEISRRMELEWQVDEVEALFIRVSTVCPSSADASLLFVSPATCDHYVRITKRPNLSRTCSTRDQQTDRFFQLRRRILIIPSVGSYRQDNPEIISNVTTRQARRDEARK